VSQIAVTIRLSRNHVPAVAVGLRIPRAAGVGTPLKSATLFSQKPASLAPPIRATGTS
jgi:hypothetical protein